MKILFAPYNIASMPAITAKAINKIQGFEARYLNTVKHEYLSQNSCGIPLYHWCKPSSFTSNPIWFLLHHIEKFTIYPIRYFITIYRWVKWADVVHWTWGSKLPFQIDIRIVKWLNKKRFVEWVGSDIRIPEVTMKESKWYKEVYNNGYEYASIESKEKSYKIQEQFSKLGFIPVLVPEMQLFLKPALFKTIYTTQYRIFDSDYSLPFYPTVINNRKIIIVHSPSAKKAKGSDIIVKVVEKLKKNYPIEFILLHGVSRDIVLETMKRCDIFIDQIVLGSYAAAAIEAMSLGKPVVAYIMPSVYEKGTPMDCPIVNANPDTLEQKLIELLENAQLRCDIGMKSRAFAERAHNADTLATKLLQMYNLEQIKWA